MAEYSKPKVGYARVSTADQNLQMQVDALLAYGIPEESIYTDKMSGATLKRPGLRRAMRSAIFLKAEFVVWKFDRLGRTVRGIVDVMQMFEENGVSVYSLTERVDLGTPFGRAIFHIMAAMAQMERDLIKERTIAGLKSARERGVQVGRKQVMTPDRVVRAAEMVQAEATVKDILATLKEMDGPSISRSALYKWIKDYRDMIPEEPTDDR